MRSILFAFAITCLFLESSNAGEALLKPGFKVVLPSLSELKKLTPYKQELYNQAIRGLFIELSKSEFNRGAKFVQNNWWINAAYAASGASCTNAGWLLKRDESGFCAPPRCPGQEGRILCRPVLYGENVCVSPSADATTDCDNSARAADKIKAYRDAHPQDWSGVQAEMNTYCASGQSEDACSLVITRLNEARVAIGSEEIPAPTEVQVVPTAAPPTQRPVARVTSRSRVSSAGSVVASSGATLTSASSAVESLPSADTETKRARFDRAMGKLNAEDYRKFVAEDGRRLTANGGCMSEMLIQGLRFTGPEVKQFIDPHEAHHIFCNGDANALKERKSAFLNKIAEYKRDNEVARAAAKAAGPSKKYEYVRLTEQLQRINSGVQALEKCGAIVSAGKKIESKNTGTLDFNSNIVKYTGNGRGGAFDKLHVATSLNVLSQWGLGARFCDYSIVPKPGTNGGGSNGTSGSSEAVK